MFHAVTTKILVNEEVTPANLQTELDRLQDQGTDKDFRLLFLSGHGAMNDQSEYYFLCYYHRIRAGTTAGFLNDKPWSDLLRPLKAQGRSILIVDTCHAAAASRDADFNTVLKNTTAEILSLVTYAASTGTENSQ